jgi:sulfur carrier protein
MSSSTRDSSSTSASGVSDVSDVSDRPEPSASRPARSSDRLVVEVNGDGHELPASSSVADLLGSLGLGGKRVAVAVNREVVVRSRYAQMGLSEGDRVEILEAVGGG